MDHRLWTNKNEHTITYILGGFCTAVCCVFNMADAAG
ncbi:MAG: hypothetical protein JWQ54_1720 [Mucilaginibacter sp.]|nr:hypothetical protein [Mucilaginibacter sp.]